MKPAAGRGRRAPGPQSGTYILLLYLPRGCSLSIGHLGPQAFARGWYLYVGSAFGPGGVRARCRHHRRVSPRPRWHIDYLRTVAPLRAIWYSHAPRTLEHRWAGLLGGRLGLERPVAGFGASDCDCPSHLFYTSTRPRIGHYFPLLRSDGDENIPLFCETL